MFGVRDELPQTGNKAADVSASLLGGAGGFIGANPALGGQSWTNVLTPASKGIENAVTRGLANKTMNELPKRLLPIVVREGSENVLQGLYGNIVNGEPVSKMAKDAAVNFAVGGTSGGLMNLSGVLKGIKADRDLAKLGNAGADAINAKDNINLNGIAQQNSLDDMVSRLNADKQVNDYYDNIEGLDWANSTDPSYTKAENDFRRNMGAPLLKSEAPGQYVPKAPIQLPNIKEAPNPFDNLTETQKDYYDYLKADNATVKNVDDYINQYKKGIDDMVNEEYEYLKANAGKGVTQGTLVRDAEGNVINRIGRISNNDEWYRKLYAELGHTPSNKDLRELAIDRLTNGYTDWGENIPPNQEFIAAQNTLNDLNAVKKYIEPSTKYGRILPVKPIENISESVEQPVYIPKVKSASVEIPEVKQQVAAAQGITPDIGEELKPRKFISNSVENAQVTSPETKAYFNGNMPMYGVVHNADTWDKAVERVTANPTKALDDFKSMTNLKNEDSTALGEALITHFTKNGDIAQANSVASDLAIKLTDAGRSVQAASILKRLTPDGYLTYANKILNKANEALPGDKQLSFTDDEAKSILDNMADAQKATTERAKDISIAKAAKVVQEKIPSTIGDKIKAYRTIAMLANPKTMIRNTLGNVIFGAAENVSNTVGTGIDKGLSAITGQRTKLLPNIGEQLRGLKQGAQEAIEDYKLGVDTSPEATQYELPKTTKLPGILGKIEKLTSTGLKLGDRPFWQAAYNDALSEQMKLNGVDEASDAMKEAASKVADYRTYQDVNGVTKLFQGMKNALNNANIKGVGLGDIVLPFAKTPSNLLARSLDYSPAGIVNVAKAAFGSGGFDQKAFVDSLSKTITGTGAMLLGYDLAKKGIITGRANSDKDVAALEKSTGKNAYSVNIDAMKRFANGKDTTAQTGDHYQTWDWAQPISTVMAIGADIYANGKDRKDAATTAIDAVKSGGQTLFNQSLLQGPQQLFGGYSPVENVGNVIQGIPQSFVPTFAKQIAQLANPTQRETYDPNALKQTLNTVKAKTPGASNSLLPKIDTSGRETPVFQGGNSLFNVVLNPGYSSTYQPTQAQKLALDIYNKAGTKAQFPRVAAKTITYQGKTYQLTPQEYNDLQKYIGQRTEQMFTWAANNENFKAYRPELQAKQLQKILTDIYEEGRNMVLQQRGVIKY
ncbi:MAG TPA: hypothetical protein DD426_14525 [Clostridiaceae bacterium]|nr:hypothetical protein [Clostridiaceae bacterium]